MMITERHTYLTTNSLSRSAVLLATANAEAHGRQIMSLAHAAARLAGGFLQPIDREVLQEAIQQVLADDAVDFGELGEIRDLSGMASALSRTFQRAWTAGIDFKASGIASTSSRFNALSNIEAAVLIQLPPSMLRPSELVALALGRLELAPRVLGPVTVVGVPDLDPVWRPFIEQLATAVPVSWQLGHYSQPEWLANTGVVVEAEEERSPDIIRVSCANPRHEAMEALRWARALISSGEAKPHEIAIAAPSPLEWDTHIAVIAADANLPVAFVHGHASLETRDGQAAAALAEILLKGLSQARVRRLLSLTAGMTDTTAAIPSFWQRIVPRDVPLLDAARWRKLIEITENWPDDTNFGEALLDLIGTLDKGIDDAADIGEALLSGPALAIWRKALKEGPARALDVSLSGVRVAEELDTACSIVWCSTAELASCPRPYMRLLGLTSRGWPRTYTEDPLLPAHILDPRELDPVPVPERDRRDFLTLVRSTDRKVVLSRARRDAEGRQTGESALLRLIDAPDEVYLRRERIPEHAVSEADRLLARPEEFKISALSVSTASCWHDWHRPELTPHDGLVRADHPVIEKTLSGLYSATRFRSLVRDPLGFLWNYALGWDAPTENEEPLTVDALSLGSLIHRVLELALVDLETSGGLAGADSAKIKAATNAAIAQAASEYEEQSPIPPRIIWHATLDVVGTLTEQALGWNEAPLANQRSYAEVGFGRTYLEVGTPPNTPWDPTAEVCIPGTDMTITGVIDRLDLAGDGKTARITDYKTGNLPKKNFALGGGGELQRCLYAYSVQALLGDGVDVETRLLYPRGDGRLLALEEPKAVLKQLTTFLVAARDHVRAGHTFIGPDSGLRDDRPLTFALPGNAKEIYLKTKDAEVRKRLAPLPDLWEMD